MDGGLNQQDERQSNGRDVLIGAAHQVIGPRLPSQQLRASPTWPRQLANAPRPRRAGALFLFQVAASPPRVLYHARPEQRRFTGIPVPPSPLPLRLTVCRDPCFAPLRHRTSSIACSPSLAGQYGRSQDVFVDQHGQPRLSQPCSSRRVDKRHNPQRFLVPRQGALWRQGDANKSAISSCCCVSLYPAALESQPGLERYYELPGVS